MADLFDLMGLDRALTPAERRALLQKCPSRATARASELPGPLGDTCGSCKNLDLNQLYRRRYYKCGLLQWTHGAGTDIRLKDPACSRWESK